MEESGSVGLDEFLWSQKDSFLKNIDYVCISDNYWLGTKKPCITYGLRGFCYFAVQVSCAKEDLHSGLYGGNVHEALPDLFYLLNTLVDKNGQILIDGIYDNVPEVTSEEMKMYDNIEFDVNEYRSNIGCTKLPHNEDKVFLLPFLLFLIIFSCQRPESTYFPVCDRKRRVFSSLTKKNRIRPFSINKESPYRKT